VRARSGQIATERRRRERAAQIAARAAVREQMLDLANAVGHVQGLHDRAELVDGEPRDQKLRDVGKMHRDHVAAADAGIRQGGREGFHPRGEACIGQRVVERPNRRAIARVLLAPDSSLLEQIFGYHAALLSCTEYSGLIDYRFWVRIEPISVTARTGGYPFCHNRIAAFAHLVEVRLFSNFGRLGRAIR